MSETDLEMPWLNGGERGILTHFGHLPDANFNEEKLARRVLEFPNTSDNWFTASAVTLAAAYLEPKRLAAPELYEALVRVREFITGDHANDQQGYAAIDAIDAALSKAGKD